MKETFDYYKPMLAHSSSVEFLETIDDNPLWVAGEKLDGYRELFYLGEHHNELSSRLGNDHIVCTPHLAIVVPSLAGTVVDTEGRAPSNLLEDAASCFKSLPENAIDWQRINGRCFLTAFDILRYKGKEIISLPFKERLKYLNDVVTYLNNYTDINHYVTQELLVTRHKLNFYSGIIARTQKEGHEGIMLKNLDAPYSPGKRTSAWLKVKRMEAITYYIKGFTQGLGKYEGLIGAIVYAQKVDGKLLTVGTSSGMDDATRIDMSKNSEHYIGKLAWFECQEVTKYGAMRHPRYKGLAKED